MRHFWDAAAAVDPRGVLTLLEGLILDRKDRARSAVVGKATILSAFAVALCYFAAARLGLALLSKPEGVAVFWPASGIAAGALILLGERGRVPIVLGVFAGTIAANLLGDRNVVMAVAFGLCNAGEALLCAWLIERRFGSSFRFGNLRNAIWFFPAAGVSTALMAVPATATIRLAGNSTASLLEIWQVWWLSDAIGIIMFAPFLITLGEVIRDQPSRSEMREGAAVLGVLVLVTAFTYFSSTNQAVWSLPLPVATIFPLLLWVAARCRPVVVAAGIMLVALMIVWATTNGLGHFGNPQVSFDDRVLAARITLISIAFCGLIMVAVSTERRSAEAVLRANEEKLARLAALAPGMICSFRIDGDGRRSMPYASSAIGSILALSLEDVRTDAEALFRLIDREDVGQIDAATAASLRALTPLRVEFRYRHPSRGKIWLEFHSAPVRESDGDVVWHGFMQDITLRKNVEAHVKFLMSELNHRAKNLLAVVQAVAFHTAREEDPAHFVDTFGKRIAGLAASYDLLTASMWEGVGIADLVHSQLAHFENLIGSRIKLEGPPIKLKPPAAQAIGMALHELATNAGKYGALSSDEGSVRIAWASSPAFRISWTEIGGPAVTPPSKRGFGHRVLVELTEQQLDATVRLEYPSSGLVWEVVAPIECTLQDGHRVAA